MTRPRPISKAHFSAGRRRGVRGHRRQLPRCAGRGSRRRDASTAQSSSSRRDRCSGATAAELARLHPGKVVVLGSASVISDAVAAQLASASGAPVSRLYGSDRYQTAVQVSRANHAAGAPSTVFVATGANFPDGLSADPVAGSAPGPLLLVPGTSLPSAVAVELARLAPDRVVVIGGRGVISDAVIAGHQHRRPVTSASPAAPGPRSTGRPSRPDAAGRRSALRAPQPAPDRSPGPR